MNAWARKLGIGAICGMENSMNLGGTDGTTIHGYGSTVDITIWDGTGPDGFRPRIGDIILNGVGAFADYSYAYIIATNII